ncbi:MAG: hypothetical protein U9O06_06510 [Euryarchaeota archaeon]|nr:hypothetical protein [Euryarchaeota archaeon]
MVDAGDYVDGTANVDYVRLMTTLGGSIVVALGAGYISLIDTVIGLNVRLINAGGGFLRELVAVTLGESSALVVDSWRAAFVASIEFGALAPIVLVVEALIMLTIVLAVWQRRPYS